MAVLKENRTVWIALSQRLESVLGFRAEEFYAEPAMYRGLAVERTRALTDQYAARSVSIKQELGG